MQDSSFGDYKKSESIKSKTWLRYLLHKRYVFMFSWHNKKHQYRWCRSLVTLKKHQMNHEFIWPYSKSGHCLLCWKFLRISYVQMIYTYISLWSILISTWQQYLSSLHCRMTVFETCVSVNQYLPEFSRWGTDSRSWWMKLLIRLFANTNAP